MNPSDGTKLFSLHDRVRIAELDRSGRIIAILQDMEGYAYKVRYFINGDPRTEFFFADELKVVREEAVK